MNANEAEIYQKIVDEFPNDLTQPQKEKAADIARTIAQMWDDDLASTSTARSLEHDLLKLLRLINQKENKNELK